MPINVGSLVHHVAIQEMTESTDASGFPLESWATLCTAWMAKQTERATEEFRSHQESASSIIRWTMRYRADVDPDLVDVPKKRRILYQSRAYDIVYAETVGRKDSIVFKTLAAV
jgi:SPP1 family predicted phage head-tail adaptor